MKVNNKIEKGLVSVIIPTYSRPDNIIRAINSVLNQTYKHFEIIVVDDNGEGSENQLMTESILKEYISNKKIKYLKHKKNINGSAARNTGFEYSIGEYINYFDDDDEMGVDKLEKQVDFMKSHLKVMACFCDTLSVYNEKKTFLKNPIIVDNAVELLLNKVFFNTSTVLFRRSVIEKLKGFDETYLRHQDWELYMRYLKISNFYKVDCNPVIKYTSPNIISQHPEKAIFLKEKFLNNFKDQIFSYKEGNEIFSYHYYDLAKLSLGSCRYKDAIYCLKNFFKYSRKLSFKGIVILGYFIIRPLIKGKI